MDTIVFYLGRILFGGYFLFGAFNHFTNVKMMAGYSQSKGLPASLANIAVVGSGVLLLIGGASVLLNLCTIIGLLALLLFLLPVTFIMHAFWKVQDPTARMGEMINFMKNIALVGGTLLLLTPLLS